MVYIENDGSVTTARSWSLGKFIDVFYGTIAFIIFFFKSLLGFNVNKPTRDSKFGGGSTWKGHSGGGHGPGGGGGGGGGSGGYPRGPNIKTMKDINPPTVNGGPSCPGGSCGM